MDVKRINDFVRNLDSAIDITGITVYGVDDEGHSVKIDTEMLANPKPTFTEASTRTNIVGSGESTTTLWGKVKKWFSDLKTVATTGVFSDLIDKNVSTGTVAFTEASSRTNIATGESQSTLWGKVKKFFTDLKSVAFSGSYNDLDNKPLSVESSKVKYTLPDGTTKLTLTQESDVKDIGITFTSDTVSGNIASGETLAVMMKKINIALGMVNITNNDWTLTEYVRDSNLYGILNKTLGILIISGWFRVVNTDIPRYSKLFKLKGYSGYSCYPLFVTEDLTNGERHTLRTRTGESGYDGYFLFVNRTSTSNSIYFEGLPTVLVVGKD